jgi:hypothetical protein
MHSIAINRRFCGPPMSATGGYVCGLVANAIATMHRSPGFGR